ncbi:MAG: hypothetical protein JST49_15370 [Bacteroidetes bacterium]|nr:hypothetical protein [Bacteroidota bacterium]
MHGSDKIRKYERFLFKGVPEVPESVYDRDGYSYIDMRKTGQSQSIDYHKDLDDKNILLGTYKYDFDKETENFDPSKKS